MFKLAVIFALVCCLLGAVLPAFSLPQYEGRIVGGSKASINQFPFQVSVQPFGFHSCGGSLFSKSVVITAAHCVENRNAAQLQIRAGSASRKEGGVVVGVASFVVHPKYDAETKAFDIALIKLTIPLTLSADIRTIPLASSTPADGTPATISGWGADSSYTYGEIYLRYADVNIISRQNCLSSDYSFEEGMITESVICAIGKDRDSCQGDSGGPLVVNGQQVGVISWGVGCGDAEFPGVYTNIAMVRSWIIENSD